MLCSEANSLKFFMKYSIEILKSHLELLNEKIFNLNDKYTKKEITDDWYRRRFSDLNSKIFDINEAIKTLNCA